MVVALEEDLDLSAKAATQKFVFKSDAAYLCLAPALDLALHLRAQLSVSHMRHPPGFDVLRQLARNAAGTNFAEQPEFASTVAPYQPVMA